MGVDAVSKRTGARWQAGRVSGCQRPYNLKLWSRWGSSGNPNLSESTNSWSSIVNHASVGTMTPTIINIPHVMRKPRGAYLQHAAQALGIAGLVARNSGMPAKLPGGAPGGNCRAAV